jgi:hypothetical protein
MRLAFYKGSKFNPIEEVIRLHTDSDFCHVELVFAGGETFSSSLDSGGTRFTHQGLDGWTIVDIGPLNEAALHAWCEQQNGKPYDVLGLVCFGLGIHDPNADKGKRWFCSMVCVAALQSQGLFKFLVPSATSPMELYIAAMAYNQGLAKAA